MKHKFFSNGQYVKLAMHLRRTLALVMPKTEARAAVMRICGNIRFDRGWAELKRKQGENPIVLRGTIC